MDSRAWFLLLVAAVGVERLVEMGLSARNARWARARGAVESEPLAAYGAMVLLHATLLAAAPSEVFGWGRPFVPALGWSALAAIGGTMALRYWAIATLGRRWTTRVLVVPGLPAVVGGPYRFLRHPNYLAVAIEVVALPLVHTAWVTALVFGAANAAILAARIRREEAALERHADYRVRLGDRRRLVPGPPVRSPTAPRSTPPSTR